MSTTSNNEAKSVVDCFKADAQRMVVSIAGQVAAQNAAMLVKGEDPNQQARRARRLARAFIWEEVAINPAVKELRAKIDPTNVSVGGKSAVLLNGGVFMQWLGGVIQRCAIISTELEPESRHAEIVEDLQRKVASILEEGLLGAEKISTAPPRSN